MILYKSILPVVLCLFLFVPQISSQEKKNYSGSVYTTLRLSDELNKLEMFEESLYLLDDATKKDPDNRDLYLVQKAVTYFAKKEDKKGLEILKSIKKTSIAYDESNLQKGIRFVHKGELKKAIPLLESFCEKMKANPPKREEIYRTEKFRKAVAYLIYAYSKLGLTDKLKQSIKFI